MVKFVVGSKDSGETKWLIDKANNEKKSNNGNIVFIDSDDKHVFTLGRSVELIDASTFHILSLGNLYGFLAEIISRDLDIKTICVNGIHSIIDMIEQQLEESLEDLEVLSKEASIKLFIGMNKEELSLPVKYHEDTAELRA